MANTPMGTLFFLPLTTRAIDGDGRMGIWDREGAYIDVASPALAIPAVRAINAHDELVAALKWFIDDIDGNRTVMVDFDANVARARAALAKAGAA